MEAPDARTLDELEEEPDVNVALQAEKKFLSLSGRARVVRRSSGVRPVETGPTAVQIA